MPPAPQNCKTRAMTMTIHVARGQRRGAYDDILDAVDRLAGGTGSATDALARLVRASRLYRTPKNRQKNGTTRRPGRRTKR